jgi:hypothetical protein
MPHSDTCRRRPAFSELLASATPAKQARIGERTAARHKHLLRGALPRVFWAAASAAFEKPFTPRPTEVDIPNVAAHGPPAQEKGRPEDSRKSDSELNCVRRRGVVAGCVELPPRQGRQRCSAYGALCAAAPWGGGGVCWRACLFPSIAYLAERYWCVCVLFVWVRS